MLIKNLNLSLHTELVIKFHKLTTYMSDFNFGQIADLGFLGGNSGVQIQEGHSSLFEPDELDTDNSFRNEPEKEDEIIDPIEPQKKAVNKPGPKSKDETPLEAQPEHSALFNEEDFNEDLVPTKEPTKNKGIPEPENEDPEAPEEDVYKSYVDDMFKAGILTPMDGDEELEYADENDVIQRFNVEKQNAARDIVNNFISQYGPDHAKAFQAIFVNGVSPEVYYQKSAHIENLEKANLEDVSIQEKLVKNLLTRQGYSPEDIEEKLEGVKSYDGLEKEAKIAHKYLLKQEQEDLVKDAQLNQQRVKFETQQAELYTQNVHAVLSDAVKKKELGGIPMTQKTAAKLFDMAIKKQWNVGGKAMTTVERIAEDIKDPRNVELALKIAALVDSGFDFSSIEKKAVTKETNTLFTSLKRKQVNARRSSPTTEVTDDWSS